MKFKYPITNITKLGVFGASVVKAMVEGISE